MPCYLGYMVSIRKYRRHVVKGFITKERLSPYSLLLKNNFKNTPHFIFKFTTATLSAFYRQFEQLFPQLLPPEGASLASHGVERGSQSRPTEVQARCSYASAHAWNVNAAVKSDL